MSTDRTTAPGDFHRIASAWLAEGPSRLDDEILRIALVEVGSTPQRRRLGWAWPRMPRRTSRGVLSGALPVVVLVAVVAGTAYVLGYPPVGPSVGASPTPGSSALVPFISPRYGYEVQIPASWIATPATADWHPQGGTEAFDAPTADVFEAGAGSAGRVEIVAERQPAGTTAEEWASRWTLFREPGGHCFGTATAWGDASVAGLSARMFSWRCSDASVAGTADYDEYAFLTNGVGFVAHGAPSMLQQLVGSFEPPPAVTATVGPTFVPLPSTLGWQPYTSARYGFTLAYPSGWTTMPADHTWTWADATNPESTGQDVFLAPGGSTRVSAWTVPLDTELPETWPANEAWATDYCVKSGSGSCAEIHHRIIPMCIENRDCHAGVIVPYPQDVQFFGHGGVLAPGMTVVVVWRPEGDPSMAAYGGAERLLETVLSTMGVFRPVYPESQQAAASFLASSP